MARRTTSRKKVMDAKVEAAVRELDAMYAKPAPSKAQVSARKGAKTRAANREANRRVDAAIKDVESMYKTSGSSGHWNDQTRWPKGSDRGGEWR